MQKKKSQGKKILYRKQKRRKEDDLFQAAEDGCLRCVRRFLESEPKVLPYAISAPESYTVTDFAKYALQKHTAGADAVVKYLEKYWSDIP